MDADIKKLLEENLRLSQENNEMLKKVRGAQKWAQIYRIAYWVVIILVSLGSFYFIQPYLGNIMNLYTGGVSTVSDLQDIGNNIPDAQHLKDLRRSIKSAKLKILIFAWIAQLVEHSPEEGRVISANLIPGTK